MSAFDRSPEATPLIPRAGGRASTDSDEEEARDSPRQHPTAFAGEESESNLMARAGKIFAFGIVATVIILLGVVSSRVASPSRASLGVPHDGMRLSPAPRVLSGNDTLAASDPDPAREARVLTRQNLRTRRRKHRHWNRGDRDGVDDVDPATRAPRRDLPRLGVEPDAGVSLNGWLQLEDWFFSDDAYSLVDTPEGVSQGVIFPPDYPAPGDLGFEWGSEGDLAAKLRGAFGEQAALAAFEHHRETYVTDDDIAAILAAGYSRVRLPVSWACFAARDGDPATLLRDPAHPEISHVTVPKEKMTEYLSRLTRAGLKVLIDVHNMPGGSSLGTYNGVYPAPPAFWDDARLMSLGRGVLRSMMQWFRELPAEARAGVDGFTLLNEPAHMLPDKLETMKRWYVDAVEDYRKLIAAPARAAGESTPHLYVNLIETAGWDVDQMADWIGSVFTPEERAEWVVLDVHTYVAWEDPVPGRTRCEDGPLVVGSLVAEFTGKKMRAARSAAARNGVANIAVSEWSLATHHDSRVGCSDPATLRAVFHAEMSAFREAGASSYFWGWKMPRGGAHRSFWDLSHFHAGADAVDASAPFASSTSSTASSTSSTASSTSSIASAASASDFDAAAAEGQGDQTGYGIEPATDATVGEADTNVATAEAEAIVDRDELANGYRAMSVEPAKQGEGRVTEMLAAAAEEQAERRAAAEREAAAEATRTAVRQACGGGGAPSAEMETDARARSPVEEMSTGYPDASAASTASASTMNAVDAAAAAAAEDLPVFADDGTSDGGGGETFDEPYAATPDGQEWGSTAEPQPAATTSYEPEWGSTAEPQPAAPTSRNSVVYDPNARMGARESEESSRS